MTNAGALEVIYCGWRRVTFSVSSRGRPTQRPVPASHCRELAGAAVLGPGPEHWSQLGQEGQTCISCVRLRTTGFVNLPPESLQGRGGRAGYAGLGW